MASKTMNAVAESFASQGIGSIFLYTHEAHPGEHYPPLRSMEQKFRHARDLRKVYSVTRPILVDTLDGACHRRYGSMPNMTWIFNRTGTVMYKSDWTNASSVENTLTYLLEVIEQRRNRERLNPFKVERIEYRPSDGEAFYDGLERNGPQAIEDFKKTFPGSVPPSRRDQ